LLDSSVAEEASHHDNSSRARELCAGLKEGEIARFDKAYVHFGQLFDLAERGVSWVTRAKNNFSFKIRRKLGADKAKGILSDDIVELNGSKAREDYPIYMRRVVAMVEANGKPTRMACLTSNLDWAASTVADLYQARSGIEVFFREIKQTLAQARGLHRIQQERHTVASLGGSAGLASGAISGVPLAVKQ